MSKIIVNIKNKQFIATIGTIIQVDKLKNKIGEHINFESVMMIINSDTINPNILGTPYIKGVIVQTEVISHKKYSKIRIVKFRRRKHYKLTKGHRQFYTELKIINIFNIN